MKHLISLFFNSFKLSLQIFKNWCISPFKTRYFYYPTNHSSFFQHLLSVLRMWPKTNNISRGSHVTVWKGQSRLKNVWKRISGTMNSYKSHKVIKFRNQVQFHSNKCAYTVAKKAVTSELSIRLLSNDYRKMGCTEALDNIFLHTGHSAFCDMHCARQVLQKTWPQVVDTRPRPDLLISLKPTIQTGQLGLSDVVDLFRSWRLLSQVAAVATAELADDTAGGGVSSMMMTDSSTVERRRWVEEAGVWNGGVEVKLMSSSTKTELSTLSAAPGV